VTQHEERDRRTGRYAQGALCDYCGKPTGVEYCTDDEVCGASDGPGFLLCSRKGCIKARIQLNVKARDAIYTAQRALNEGRAAPALTLAVHSVLAAAYPGGKRADPKVMLTHVAQDHDFDTALCGRVRAGALCDVEEEGPPTCTTCAQIMARLQSTSTT